MGLFIYEFKSSYVFFASMFCLLCVSGYSHVLSWLGGEYMPVKVMYDTGQLKVSSALRLDKVGLKSCASRIIDFSGYATLNA